MQGIMKADATSAVHAPNSDTNNAATACGIVGGAWVSTESAVICQTCIRLMAAQVSKGIPHYRKLLQEALDAEFTYKENDGLLKEGDGIPVTLDICERGITLNIPDNDRSIDAYTISWKELIGMRDIVNASAGGVNRISIVTEAGK